MTLAYAAAYASVILMSKKRRRLGNYERDILEHLSLGDLLYAHLHSARSTKRFYKLARERATERYRRKKAMERLEHMGYVKRVAESLTITEDGRTALGAATMKTRDLLGSEKWDLKWRVAAFDIPEKFAVLRNRVRFILKRAGFIQLQHSVWVFPHECEELIQLIKHESKLTPYILYGVLERIENEERLKKLFKLDRWYDSCLCGRILESHT